MLLSIVFGAPLSILDCPNIGDDEPSLRRRLGPRNSLSGVPVVKIREHSMAVETAVR